jgi:hypothetical protein
LITGPITAANDVTCSGTCNRDSNALRTDWLEIGIAKRRRDQFRARLAVRVGIVPAKRIVLPISPRPLFVFIALIARNINYDAGLAQLPQCLQKMDGPHDIGGVSFDGVLVAAPDDGLRSHVNDHLGKAVGDCRS